MQTGYPTRLDTRGGDPQAGPRFARCHFQPDPIFNILQTYDVNYEIPIQENHLLPSFTGQPGSGWRLGSQGAELKANAISNRTPISTNNRHTLYTSRPLPAALSVVQALPALIGWPVSQCAVGVT